MNNSGTRGNVFISAQQLLSGMQGGDPLCILDLSKAENYAAGHVPGAMPLDEKRILATRAPIGGLLPDDAVLSGLLSELGITASTWVVAYDDQGNNRSGRLMWTLEVLGHTRAAILDGGLGAWRGAGQTVSQEPSPVPVASYYPVQAKPDAQADKDWILEHLGDPGVVFLDVRTAKEFRGEDVRSLRGGHVPGAVNYDWLRSHDPNRYSGLRPLHEISSELQALGVSADKQVVLYCQTHMRSSHMYGVLMDLGFNSLRGYPGAWSDWGNAPGLPIEK